MATNDILHSPQLSRTMDIDRPSLKMKESQISVLGKYAATCQILENTIPTKSLLIEGVNVILQKTLQLI